MHGKPGLSSDSKHQSIINCLQGVSYGKVNSYEQGERNKFDQVYERYVSMDQEQGLQGQ